MPAASKVALALGLLALLFVACSRGGGQTFRPPTACGAVYQATTRGLDSLPGASDATGRPGPVQQARVRRVVDGDTILLDDGRRVRYIGVDAPETGQRLEPLGDEAAALNRRLVAGRRVFLVSGVQDRDRFGRLLRYVFAEGVLAEAELVREGLAAAREYQPGQPYAACTAVLQQDAQQHHRGLWAQGR